VCIRREIWRIYFQEKILTLGIITILCTKKNKLNDISQLLVAIFQYYDILKNLLRTAFKKEFRHLLRYQVFEADCVTSENK
jgi:hypothetical protein